MAHPSSSGTACHWGFSVGPSLGIRWQIQIGAVRFVLPVEALMLQVQTRRVQQLVSFILGHVQ